MDRRGRIVGIFLVMGLGFAAVAGRLVYLQVFERAELTARAEQQQESLITIEPKRGTIFDRMGRELAVSLDVDSIYGVPSAAKNPRLLARRLSPALHEDPRALERKFSSGRSFVWLSRKADPAKAERVKALGLTKEVGFLHESRRFYPKKTLAGPVLGFTSVDNEGLEGIEREYDKVLRGVSGRVLAEKDAFGRMVFPGGPGFQYTLPKAGKDVVLTIDEVIQHIAEKELDRALAGAHARGGVCLVMNPQTGELLALSVRARGMAEPRRDRCLRARLHFQAGPRSGGPRGESGASPGAARLQRRKHQGRRPGDQGRPQKRRADLYRRDCRVEQCGDNQGFPAAG